jgi:hypothetical protein
MKGVFACIAFTAIFVLATWWNHQPLRGNTVNAIKPIQATMYDSAGICATCH